MKIRFTLVVEVIVMGVGLLALYPLLTQQPLNQPIAFFEVSEVDEIDWHPDSQRIAVREVIYSINDPSSRTYISLDPIGSVNAVMWSPDGRSLALAGHKVWVWDDTGSTEITESNAYRSYTDIIWTGDYLVATSIGLTDADNFIRIWNPETRELLAEVPGDDSFPTTNAVGDKGFTNVEFIANSTLVITTSFENNQKRFWDISTTQSVDIVDDPSYLDVIRPSPSGEFIAIADEQKVRILSMPDMSEIQTLDLKLSNADVLEWNYSDTLLLVGDSSKNEIEIWDIDQNTIILSESIPRTTRLRADWNSQSNHFAISTDEGVMVWSAESRDEKWIHSGQTLDIEWSPDGETIAIITREGIYVYSI